MTLICAVATLFALILFRESRTTPTNTARFGVVVLLFALSMAVAGFAAGQLVGRAITLWSPP